MDEAAVDKKIADAIGDILLEDQYWLANGVEGRELARAMLIVLARRYGPSFVEEVSDELAVRRDSFAGTTNPEDAERQQLLSEAEIWRDLDDAEDIARASATSV